MVSHRAWPGLSPLAVLDINPADDPPLSMLDPDWTPELAAMSTAILDIADS
jgi:hypothetical protein